MNKLSDWQNKYNGYTAQQLSDADQCIDDFLRICKGKHLVLWGANMHGKTLQKLFGDIGLSIDAFVDRDFDSIKDLNGVEVLSPESLSSLFPKEDTLLIASVNMKNFYSVEKDLAQIAPDILLGNGFLLHYPLQSAVCLKKVETGNLEISHCSCCTKVNQTCPVLRKNLITHKPGARIRVGGAKNTLIGCIISTMCTLKCKHCVEHVPYITGDKRLFLPKEKIIEDIRVLAEAYEFATIMDFVGGEPFLHPDLPEIIENTRNIENIGIVNVFTNGTVMPGKELLSQLAKPYTTVYLSNYSKNLSTEQREKIIATEKALTDVGVMVFQAKDFSWFDTTSFDETNDDEDTLTNRYSQCILRDCYRLYDGKLFRCLHHYAGYITNNIPADKSVIRIHDSPETLVERLNKFAELPYAQACRYCEMPYNAKPVSSGIQL